MLGPRNRRRLFMLAAAAVVVTAVVVGTALLTRPASHSTSSSDRALLAMNAGVKLNFGMTPKQVRDVTGNPTKVRGSCWYFTPKDGMVGKLSMGVPGSLAARSKGDLRFCFYGGAFNTADRHYYVNGAWRWVQWVPRVTIVKPGAEPDRVG